MSHTYPLLLLPTTEETLIFFFYHNDSNNDINIFLNSFIYYTGTTIKWKKNSESSKCPCFLKVSWEKTASVLSERKLGETSQK